MQEQLQPLSPSEHDENQSFFTTDEIRLIAAFLDALLDADFRLKRKNVEVNND
jgi:hypothetical protein